MGLVFGNRYFGCGEEGCFVLCVWRGVYVKGLRLFLFVGKCGGDLELGAFWRVCGELVV